MNYELDGYVWETICECLENNGVTPEQLDKAEESIKYNFKETNFLHNSVANSNYYAAEERKENTKLKEAYKETDKVRNQYEKEISSLNYEIRQLRYENDRLSNQIYNRY